MYPRPIIPWGNVTKSHITLLLFFLCVTYTVKVVIAGSGMIGNSVAYHLVQRGWSDIVIIDKGW